MRVSSLMLKNVLCVIFVSLSTALLVLGESVKTDSKLVSLLVGELSGLPEGPSEVRRLKDFQSDSEYLNEGDEVYDLSAWFLSVGENKSSDPNDDRWVYYNQTNGYIVAFVDMLTYRTIQSVSSYPVFNNGFSPRLKVIYLEVSDAVEMNFEAIQKVQHEILYRSSSVLKYSDRYFDTTDPVKMSLSSNSTCSFRISKAYNWKYCDLVLDLKLEGGVNYSDDIRLVPNQWMIHECGISKAGKKGVLALRVDHVNDNGENIEYPFKEFFKGGERRVKSQEVDPFSSYEDSHYRFYSVPPDIFMVMGSGNELRPIFPEIIADEIKSSPYYLKLKQQKIPDAFEYFFKGAEVVYYEYQNLLCIKCSDRDHREYQRFFSQIENGRSHLLSSPFKLLFYEIDSVKGQDERSWGVEDLLSRNPIKLGGVYSVDSLGLTSIKASGKDECKIELSSNYPDTEDLGSRVLECKVELHLPSFGVEKIYEDVLEIGKSKVVKLGVNPENGKLKMMLIDVHEM